MNGNITIIVNNVNRQKVVDSIEYLKKLGYKIISGCTYDDYLQHDNKHMYFVVKSKYIFQGNCNIPYEKKDFLKFDHVVYYEEIFKKQMDIE